MNAAGYGWLVLLSPLVGLAFNIGFGPSVSRRAVAGSPRSRSSRASSSRCSR